MMHRLLSIVVGLFVLIGLAACGNAPMAGMEMEGNGSAPMAGMDHSTMDMGTSDAPYDAVFIDGMIEHHRGALVMAEQALAEAEQPELRALAEEIIAAQQAEIAQMEAWREAWYPDLAPTGGMAMDMGPMAVPDGEAPFDQRFIEAMIPHHESAIVMARDAQAKAERSEIRDLSEEIIAAQSREIAQMEAWLGEWFTP